MQRKRKKNWQGRKVKEKSCKIMDEIRRKIRKASVNKEERERESEMLGKERS